MTDQKLKLKPFASKDYRKARDLWLECELISKNSRELKKLIDLKRVRNKDLFLVFEHHGRIIGTVMGRWDGWRGWIYKLAVARDHRREGIASLLVMEVMQRLRNKYHARFVRAYIEKGNRASCSLFEGLGFEKMEDMVLVTIGRQ